MAKPSIYRKKILHRLRDHSHGNVGYLELGNPAGPCVVFRHGFGADMMTWQYCLAPLVRQYRLIALDLPGHGKTGSLSGAVSLKRMVGWLCETLALLDIERAILVGHSMGGSLSVAFARKYPYHVVGLVLIAPAGISDDFDPAPLRRFMQTGTEDEAGDLADLLLNQKSKKLIEQIRRSLLSNRTSNRQWSALQALLETGLSGAGPDAILINELPCPVHVIWGCKDRLTPRPKRSQLGRNTQVKLLRSVGHLAHIEAATVVTSTISMLAAERQSGPAGQPAYF